MAATSAAVVAGVRPGLVWELVLRDLRLRYRRSVLGVLWSQATPIAYAAVLTVVFTRVVPLDIDDYPVFVLLGMLPWLWFQAALTGATGAVVAAPDLLRHPGFPRVALPLAAVGASAAHHVLALPVAIVAAAVVTGGLSWPALSLVWLLGVQALLCAGPALVLAAWHVRLRDTLHLVGVVLLPVFYATPVFYDASALDAVPAIRWLNPMVPVIDGYRDALLEQRWPAAGPLAAVAAVGAVLLAVGLAVYRRRMGRFLEHL
jgi:lipopolysaccharide transport system permease protein